MVLVNPELIRQVEILSPKPIFKLDGLPGRGIVDAAECRIGLGHELQHPCSRHVIGGRNALEIIESCMTTQNDRIRSFDRTADLADLGIRVDSGEQFGQMQKLEIRNPRNHLERCADT